MTDLKSNPSLPDLSDDYHMALIGNGRTCALVDAVGSIVFACLPDFDSGTVFASLLDEQKGGRFGIAMVDGQVVSQQYERHTNILVTRFQGAAGIFELIDFMPRYTTDSRVESREDVSSDIVRVLRVVEGEPQVRVTFDPKLEYARGETWVEEHGQGLKATTHWEGPSCEIYESVYLWTNLDAGAIRRGEGFSLKKDGFLLLSYHDKVQVPNPARVELMLQRTRAYWMLWVERTHKTKLYQEEMIRSALLLKMLQFSPSGALVAAATTSLPETIGEERNWDYRFCWIRDASMTVAVLHKIGHPSMASRFIDWMLQTMPTKDDSLQIMYGIRGERELTEKSLDHLSGYQGSQPVRIGNAAYTQNQHDIYGVMLDVIYQDLMLRRRTPESLDQIWTRVRSVARIVLATWQEPDRGIWEIRGEKRHFVFSKMLCWVAIDRAIKIAELLGKTTWADSQRPALARIHEDIHAKGWSESKQAFVQAYGADDLDASNLLMAEYGFIDPTHPRFVSTVEQSEKELCEDGLMFRYRNEDDFGKPQSAFTVCSFWMVKALVQIKQKERGREMFESLLAAANEHKLYGEDLDIRTRRHLGNFPQAYCHLALIDCALALSAEEDDELIQS
ncbi:glycoside hydrolase family 15 protein [Roseibacillus ishigakijimensis]|uniref:Glycoside hydrolase family 15 protein n=1 Tax=Roseibacillus ishigakijimensis TaxID=454146 RepID=A0A934VMX5_9BACT|nr:glycoside hydrolase family 15 protein [Roseibacillus ishigakijimensis]MBK1834722.1 glycoside hydrolase family 15 protein [Roseibacillus ishigakijimensis]